MTPNDSHPFKPGASDPMLADGAQSKWCCGAQERIPDSTVDPKLLTTLPPEIHSLNET